MATGSGGVNMTVKELIALHGESLSAQVSGIDTKVDKLATKVDAIESRVESLTTAAAVKEALDARQAEVDSREITARWRNKDYVVSAIGVGTAITIGLLNLLLNLHGLPGVG